MLAGLSAHRSRAPHRTERERSRGHGREPGVAVGPRPTHATHSPAVNGSGSECGGYVSTVDPQVNEHEAATDIAPPRRVLIVSASMGEGHNATGAALHEAIARLWPGAVVRWADVLEVMGFGCGPLFRRIYATSVERLPWLYEFFYGRMWRYRWFARAAKRVIGAWSGRTLAPVIDEVAPDLVVSTYPMASTGLEWLRGHRGLAVRTGAWVSDFAPHPSWVHAGVDLNLVMHDVAVPPAQAGEPGAAITVSAPPVSAAFQPGERMPARRHWRLPKGSVLGLVSCGSLGFGSLDRTVAELLEGGGDMHVVVVAGRNEPLRAQLADGIGRDQRVHVLGWVEDMASLMRAADFVVTNAGGATFLEAMACGRTVLMHNPIAGHGRANAELMAAAGLATVCAGPGALSAAMRRLHAFPESLRASERAIAAHLNAHRLEDGLRALAAHTPRRGTHALRTEDSLFVHVQTPTVPQQVGTVLVFEPAEGATAPTRLDTARLLDSVPGVHGYLRDATVFGKASWRPAHAPTADALVDQVRLAGTQSLADAIDEFFSEPLDSGRCASARLVPDLPDGGRAVLIKLHHALGDGITVLRGLLSGADDADRSWATRPVPPVGRGRAPRPKRPIHGLWNMARAGTAPACPSTEPITSAARHYERLRLPVADLQRTAKKLNVTASELLHTLFAEAVHRVNGAEPNAPSRLRVMLPWSLRGTTGLRTAGNSAGALAVDLPVDAMPPRERTQRVATAVRECANGGMPELTGAVVRMLGRLPPPLHRLASRMVYRSTWFNAIGTVLPGPRWDVRLHGARVTAAYPVLPLAPGVGLSWGALTWRDSVTLCFTVPGHRAETGHELADAARRAFADLVELPVS